MRLSNAVHERTIPEFFAGQRVFLTGGTGFMGKVLIEKILRSCPLVGKIYVLVRAKKGMDLNERIEKITNGPLFERLRKERPGIVEEKLVPIRGDVAELGLGLSEADRKFLKDNVTLMYHVAATVRFDQPLKDAIIINTRGTVEACKLALECKKLKVFLHVSTAYCHCDRDVIEERLYPAHADWQKCVEIAEDVRESELDALAPIFMNGFPNTYTYTKSLAESAVTQLLTGKVPNIILRPSIVISTKDEPVPGWLDNFNGPVGLFVASGTGLIRISFTADIIADFVPVDSVIKCMLIVTWDLASQSREDALKETVVYNASTNKVKPLKMSRVVEMATASAWDCPMEKCVWYPSAKTTTCPFVYYMYLYLFQLLPALFFDGMLRLMNYPPSVLKLQRRVHTATMALKFFMMNSWNIDNTNTYNTELLLLPSDMDTFGYDAETADADKLFRDSMIGAKRYLLKEDPDNVEGAIKRYRMYYYLDMLVSIGSYVFLVYFLHYKLDLFYGTAHYIDSYLNNL